MNDPRTRREFLSAVGQGMLVASVGAGLASDLGLSVVYADEPAGSLSFGSLEPLVVLMQETPVERLLPTLVETIGPGGRAAHARGRRGAGQRPDLRRRGLRRLPHDDGAGAGLSHVARAARRPACPAGAQSALSQHQPHPGARRPANEVLHPVEPSPVVGQAAAKPCEPRCEPRTSPAPRQTFAGARQRSPDDAFNDLLYAVQDHTEVHRVVLPYRAWDLLGLIGREQAHTLLRQSVRYCVKAEALESAARTATSPRTLLPKLLDEHKLLDRAPGAKTADDAWVEQLSQTIFEATPERGRRGGRRGAGRGLRARRGRRGDLAGGQPARPARRRPHAARRSRRQAARQRPRRLDRRPRLRLGQRLAQHGPRRQRAEHVSPA